MLININIVKLPVNSICILLPQFQFKIAFQDQKLFQAQFTELYININLHRNILFKHYRYDLLFLNLHSYVVIYCCLILLKWYVLLTNIKKEYIIYTITSLKSCRNRQSVKKLCNQFVEIHFL